MPDCTVLIDDRPYVAADTASVLDVCRQNRIWIPTLCHDERLDEAYGGCRLCLVEIEGAPDLLTACTTRVRDQMVIRTGTDQVHAARKAVLELILSEHPNECMTCEKDGGCRLQAYAYHYQADPSRYGRYERKPTGPNYTTNNKGILYDAERCIKCGLCIRYCETVQMTEALTFAGRASGVEISTPFGIDLHESSCEMCGGCIRVCPVGAMLDRSSVGAAREAELTRVRTTCPYCAVGCQMDLMVDRRRNRIVKVTSEPGPTINNGNLCVKGHFGFEFVASEDRLTHPLIRRNGQLEQATWEEAIALVAVRLREARDTHGPDALAFISSARCTNEENYLMQKLARAAGGTNNVDNCATACHAPSVAGLGMAFGSGAMSNSTVEIRDCRVLFLIGANPTEAHPIFALEMKRALRRGAKLIVCDPRRTWIAERADIHIQHRPGSDNMLLNGMMRCILDEGLANREFIESRCESFDEFRANLQHYTVEEAASYCGVDAELIRQAARWYATGNPSGIYYTLGITEHSCGTDNVLNVANLAMLCGQIGKWASGVNPLRGQNNVQGACDMGAMAHKLPGYQDVADPAARERFEKAWGVPVPDHAGGKIPSFIDAAGRGDLKVLYVMGEDPAMTEPNTARVVRDLHNLDLLVVQDIFLSETAKLADVVLPAACWAEKDGTFSASERRMQLVRKAVEPPGEARTDWEILCAVSTAMGYPMSYRTTAEIFDEMSSLSPVFGGMSHQRLDECGGLQWPCPTPDHPGTRFLHKDRFTRGKGKFHPITFAPQKEEPDEEYPLILSTGRTLYNFNCGTMSRRSAAIHQMDPASFVEIHPDTAERHGIAPDETIVVRTRRGRVTARARVGERVRPDTIWMPFHFVEEPVNVITNDVFDPVTATAEYKCCAAALERL